VGAFSFLSNHNFDFNKWIYDGIGFIAKGEFEHYQKALELEELKRLELEQSIDFYSNDSIIYSNSKFLDIKEWIEECQKSNDFTTPLKIDLTLTPYKYFYGLTKNLPR
jgi:hypothetical protein